MKTKIVLAFKDDLPVRRFNSCLKQFLPIFKSYLDSNIGSEYELIIVEEYTPETITFNLGRTINIGFDIFKESMENNDIFMFHPIDILPIDTNYAVQENTKFCMAGYKPSIFHVFKSQKFLDGHYYYKAVCIKKQDFQKINGFTNEFVGWGGEDDDFFFRLELSDIELDIVVNEYERLTHDGSHGPNHDIHLGIINRNYNLGKTSESGLDTLKYDIVDIKEEFGIKKYQVR